MSIGPSYHDHNRGTRALCADGGANAASGGLLRSAAFILGLVLLALIVYRGAVFAMAALASKIISLIDLNRLQLLVSLGLRPGTINQEVALFKELKSFFVQAVPRTGTRPLNIPRRQSGS
jgi:hypothetical protein